MQLLAHNFPFAQQTLVEDEDALAKVDTLPLIMRNNHHGILLLPQAARTWSNNTLLPAPSIEPVSLPTSDIISRNPNPSWVAQAITDYDANNAFGGLQRGYTDHGGGPYNVTDMGYYQEPLMSSGDMHMLGHLQVKPEVAEAFNDSMKMGLNLGGRMFFTRDDVVSPLLRLGKRSRPNSLCIAQPVLCQVQGCKADLSLVKAYHRRHKVCQLHSKSAIVIVNGITQRFCQQCSRFHGLSEFDEGKRSCRKRLADHNRRRRKPQPRSHSSYSATSDCTQGSSIMAITTCTPIPTTIATNFSTTISDVTTAGIKSSRKVRNVYEEEPNGSEISHLKNCMTDNVNRVGKEQMATKFLHGTNEVQQMQVYGGYGQEGNLLAGSESTSGIEGLQHMGSSLPWKLWSSPTTKGLLPIPESNSNGLLFFLAQEGEACSDNLSLSTQNLVPLYFASSPSPTLNAASSSSSISHDQQYSTTSSSPEWMIQPLPSAHTPPPLEQLQPFRNEFPSTRQNHSQLTHYENQMFSLFDEERQVEKKVTNDQNKTFSLQPWKLEEAIANNQ